MIKKKSSKLPWTSEAVPVSGYQHSTLYCKDEYGTPSLPKGLILNENKPG